jgi:hypothetical protein
MNSKIVEVKTQKIEVELTTQEKANFRQLLNELDTIYHCEPSTCDDMKIIANLWSAMVDFKNRYF